LKDGWAAIPIIINRKGQGSAFGLAFGGLGKKKAVIIGSDCPFVDSALVRRAMSWLDDIDCVIGPSFDGGYYLIALKRNYPDIFKGIRWSTRYVFKETLERLKKRGLTYRLLDKKRDIDTEQDLVRVMEEGRLDVARRIA
jgi:glycosyltransferase A (GT-A) superfamily protein (DUF2064 family)